MGMLCRLAGGRRTYERVGAVAASQRSALVIITAARGYAEKMLVDYVVPEGSSHVLATLRSHEEDVLREFADDVASAGMEVSWLPIRTSRRDPALERLQDQRALHRAFERLLEAEAADGPPSPASPAVLIEHLGHAAASVSPATAASSRTRAALADVYERLTGAPAPFDGRGIEGD